MKKAVLISMKPKNVELVLNRYETLEICKTRPLLETPFKCYIYCTAGNLSYKVNGGMVCNVSGGKMVVGEFVCDKITWLTHIGFSGLPGIRLAAMKNGHTIDDSFDFPESCLTTPQIEKYLGGRDGYAWHISKLEIYDAPKRLNDFKLWNRECKYSDLGLAIPVCNTCRSCYVYRPPQSWCYVEELK